MESDSFPISRLLLLQYSTLLSLPPTHSLPHTTTIRYDSTRKHLSAHLACRDPSPTQGTRNHSLPLRGDLSRRLCLALSLLSPPLSDRASNIPHRLLPIRSTLPRYHTLVLRRLAVVVVHADHKPIDRDIKAYFKLENPCKIKWSLDTLETSTIETSRLPSIQSINARHTRRPVRPVQFHKTASAHSRPQYPPYLLGRSFTPTCIFLVIQRNSCDWLGLEYYSLRIPSAEHPYLRWHPLPLGIQ